MFKWSHLSLAVTLVLGAVGISEAAGSTSQICWNFFILGACISCYLVVIEYEILK